MKTTKNTTGGGTGRAAAGIRSPRQNATAYRDWNGNRRKSGAPFGRYEDLSAIPASQSSKKAIKRVAAEGPKKSKPKKGK